MKDSHPCKFASVYEQGTTPQELWTPQKKVLLKISIFSTISNFVKTTVFHHPHMY